MRIFCRLLVNRGLVNLSFVSMRCVDLYEASEPPCAVVSDLVLMYSKHIQNAQQQIGGGNRFGREGQVPSALELSGSAARQDIRHVVVQVLVGVAHVGAVQDQGVIEQRAVAVRSAPELVEEVGQASHVVP